MIGRHVAPAGAPIGVRDLTRWIARCTEVAGASGDLRLALCGVVQRRHCELTCTGRAGLSVLLSALKALAPGGRNEVIVPSYTCFSVAASVVRAGLRVRVVDVDTTTLDFDLDRLARADYRRVVAIVATNLYGLPCNMPRIAAIAAAHGVFLVDDAAQSLGADVGGRPSGSWGDAGLISFDKGKPISAIDGGAIVADSDEIALEVRDRVAKLPAPGAVAALEHLAKVAAYAACLRPSLYWLPNSIPALGLGQTPYQPDTELARHSPWLAALAATMVGRLADFTAHRAKVAAQLDSRIRPLAHLQPLEPVASARPVFLRFPLLAAARTVRDELVHELQRGGIGASASYPKSLADVAELRPHFAATPDAMAGRLVAQRIFTLPTHPYVTDEDVDRMVTVLTRFGADRYVAAS